MLEIVKTDLFVTPADAFVIPVNCVGVMGAGLALQFRKRFPEGFAPYREACDRGELRPGEVMYYWRQGWEKEVIFFPTKDDWRQPSRIEWVREGLRDMGRWLGGWGVEVVAMPALGCGCGGLKWEEVWGVMQEELAGRPERVMVCRPQRAVPRLTPRL